MNYKIVSILSIIFIFIVNRYCIINAQKSCQTFIFDEDISQEQHAAVIEKYKQYRADGLSDKDSINALMKQFLAIKNILINYFPFETVIKIVAHKPCYLINNAFVFTDNNAIVSHSFFSLSVVEDLFSVTVADHVLNDSALMAHVFEQASEGVLSTCNVGNFVLTSKNKISASFNDDPHFTIVYTAHQTVPPTLFDSYKQIKDSLLREGLLEKSTSIQWVLDIRFAHFIVAYKA